MAARLLRGSFCTRSNPVRPFYSNTMALTREWTEDFVVDQEPSSSSGLRSRTDATPLRQRWIEASRSGGVMVHPPPIVTISPASPLPGARADVVELSAIEVKLVALIKGVDSIDSTRMYESLVFLNKCFDTLTLSESSRALRLIGALESRRVHPETVSILLTNVCDRIRYLLSHDHGRSESVLIPLLSRALDLNHNHRCAHFVTATVVSLIDPTVVLQNKKLVRKLCGKSHLRDHIVDVLSACSDLISPVNLPTACGLLELAVSIDAPQLSIQVPLLRRVDDLLRSQPVRDPSLISAIAAMVTGPASIWERQETASMVAKIVRSRLYPTSPSDAHLTLASAMVRLGGISKFTCTNSYEIVRGAVSMWESDQPSADILRVLAEYRLPSIASVDARRTPRIKASEAGGAVVRKLTKQILSDSSPELSDDVLASYAQVVARCRPGTVPVSVWSSLLDRMLKLDGAGDACDLVTFLNAANTSTCPQTVNALIQRAVVPMAVMAVRKGDSVSNRLINAVGGDGEVDRKVRNEIVQKLVGQIRIQQVSPDVGQVVRVAGWISRAAVDTQSIDTVSVVRDFILRSVLTEKPELSNTECLSLIDTVRLRDPRWTPLVEFGLTGLHMESLSVDQHVGLGECIALPGFADNEFQRAWRDVAFTHLLPDDKERFANGRDGDMLGALKRKSDRIRHLREFPDGTDSDPLSTVKAFCGLFLSATVCASAWTDGLVS